MRHVGSSGRTLLLTMTPLQLSSREGLGKAAIRFGDVTGKSTLSRAIVTGREPRRRR